MAKEANLIMRVDVTLKDRLLAASRKTGLTLTTIVTSAIEKSLSEIERKPVPKSRTAQRGGLPTFFRAHCYEAQQGGEAGYANAGYHLGLHVRNQLDGNYDSDDIDQRIEALHALLDASDDAGVLNWFDEELPRCMRLVPRRRRDQFLQGVYGVHEERGID